MPPAALALLLSLPTALALAPALASACPDLLCLGPGVQNPGFEECTGCAPDAGALPDGWVVARGDGVPEWTRSDAYTGTASLRLPCTSPFPWESTAVRSALVPIAEGRGYLEAFRVTAMARSEGATVIAMAGIAWYAADGTNYASFASGTWVDSTWVQVGRTGSSQSPNPATHVAVILVCLQDGAPGTALFDEVQFLHVH